MPFFCISYLILESTGSDSYSIIGNQLDLIYIGLSSPPWPTFYANGTLSTWEGGQIADAHRGVIYHIIISLLLVFFKARLFLDSR